MNRFKPYCLSLSYLERTSLFELRFRGKGDFYRLGHGNDSHVRRPHVVESLKGKKVIDVAVGALHCLAVTDEGEVSLILSDNLANNFPLFI